MKENRGMRAETARPGKRPLRALSAAEKMEAIQRVHDGESKASVARDIGVPESTLRGWCKSEHKIRGMARNSSTPDSEAHSPASSSGANVAVSQNAGASHSSEDEGPIQKRMKAEHQVPVSHSLGVDTTESVDSKVDSKKYDYLGLMSMAAANLRQDSSALLLQHLGMMSASAKNYMSLSSGLGPAGPVGLVENGLQYTKSGLSPSLNNKRHSISAIAPTQMDSLVKSASRKSLPAAAEAPTTQVPASPNVQMSNVHLSNQLSNQLTSQLSSQMSSQLSSQMSNPISTQLSNQLINQLANPMTNQMPNVHGVNDKKNGSSNGRKMDEALWMWLTQQQQIIGQQSAAFNPNVTQEGSWFWQWYKQFGFPVSTPTTTTTAPQNNTVPKKSSSRAKAMLDNVLCNNNNNENVKRCFNVDEELDSQADVPHTTEEAIEHGEKFFKWLDKCSDPAVTRLQIVQFKILLDKLKDCKKKRASPSLKQSRK